MKNRTEKDPGSWFMSSTAAGISTKLGDESIYFLCLALWVQGRGKRERMRLGVDFQWGLSALVREFVFQLGFGDRVRI